MHGSALHLAALSGHRGVAEAAEALLKAACNTDIQDKL
jgi:ankyrin repeat protein